jgi:hypothetical protein
MIDFATASGRLMKISTGRFFKGIPMAIESIVRARHGTGRREVRISEIVVHDIRTFPLFLPDERWIAATARYYDDLVGFLDAVRADRELPAEFFVPDLWDTAVKLPHTERELMLDVWQLGHDLARELGYDSSHDQTPVRNEVGGTVYVR